MMPPNYYPGPPLVSQVIPSTYPQGYAGASWPQAMPSNPRLGQQPQPRQPVYRGVPEEEPTPPRQRQQPTARLRPLTMPSPETLGIAAAKITDDCNSIDWNVVERRLQELGSVGSQIQQLPEGGYRFTCLLPTTDPSRQKRIDAQGNTKAEAARRALRAAEAWTMQR